MKIEINLKILLVFILFFIFNNISTYIIFIIFIFFHEFAHFIAGIMIGGRPKSVTFNPFGFSLEFYSYGKDNFIRKIFFYSAGPVINFIFALIFVNLTSFNFYKNEIIYTNLGLAFFNLIPILPLDGGKILKEILKEIWNLEKANKIMIIFSKTLLVTISFIYSILIIKVKNIMLVFLIGYLWHLYMIEEKKYYIYKKTSDSIKSIL